MRDGGTSGPAPFLAAVLPLLAGPLTLGLLQLALDTRPDAGRSLQDLWYEGGRVVMTVAAVVAALAALGSGVALFAVGRGKVLAVAALPALALTVMLPAVVGARLGWAELASAFPSVRGWERPLVLAGGALEVERVVLATLLFDALLFACWAAALLLLALDARSPARKVLAALALISAALGALFGATAHVDLLRAAVEEVPRYGAPKDLLEQLLPAAARWSLARAHARVAGGVFGAVLVLAVIATPRARLGVAAWGLLCVAGVSGAHALTRVPAALVDQARPPALTPADYLDFDGDFADVRTASAVLGERLEPLNLSGTRVRVANHRVLLAKDATATGLRVLLEDALAEAPEQVELLSLQAVSVEAPSTVLGLLQRSRAVRVELRSRPNCPGPCLLATLDARGLQLVGMGERWPLEEHGPGSGDRARPLFLELAVWEPGWLIGAVHAAAKRGHHLVIVERARAHASLAGPPAVQGPLPVAAVQAVVGRLECSAPETGLLNLRVVVGPAGTVGHVQVRQSTLENARLEACFAQQLREWRFPRAPRPSLVDLDFAVTQSP